jgi:predicted unusual protein kinase regulating ubiquinone biosynthesis (AarF/ABC1/UbiB family)
MIYDFGMSKKIKKNNIKYLVSDYAGIISAFLNEDFENIDQISPDSNIKKDLYEIIEIFNNIYKTMDAEDSKSSPKKIQKEIFNIIINEIFKKYELNDMFITDYGEPLASHKIPQNIINKTPYYI